MNSSRGLTTRRMLALMGLLALVGAAIDAQTTWSDHAYRPQDLGLPLQTVIAWALLGLLMFLPARRLAGKWGQPATAASLALFGLVVIHRAVRDPMRSGGLSDPSFWFALVVACGILIGAVILGRLIERSVTRRGFGWPVAALTLVTALVLLVPGLTGQRADVEMLPERRTARDERPNLLLLVWDTTRADRLMPYGADRELTPNLARLAGQGAVFENSWSSSVFTLSSHTSLLTGLPPTLHATTLRSQAVQQTTIATRLKQMGYRTGAFVGTSVLAGGNGLERDFDVYDDRVDPPVCDTMIWSLVHDVQAVLADVLPFMRGNGLPHWFQDFQRPASEVFAAARNFSRRDDGRPWFLFVNVFDVHWPYLPDDESAARFVRDYDGPLDGYLFRSDHYPENYAPGDADKRFVGDLYDAEMWRLDQQTDTFLQELDIGRGDVAVVMTADHGEGLGEAGRWSHEHLHGPQTRVPLVVYAPGRVAPGTRVDANVSGSDVTPTLLGLAGLPSEALATMEMAGVSLVEGAPDAEREVYIQDYDNVSPARDSHAVVRGRFKLILRGDQATLHDIIDDPLDEVDVSSVHPELAAELKSRLQFLLDSAPDASGEMVNLDALRALGYIGR